ncbi:hypothetical protein IJ00_21235 [Calothrix sp. 336/3]|nr:hypothetical protein IJ00_21235 [Calothrix sp. 336/3]
MLPVSKYTSVKQLIYGQIEDALSTYTYRQKWVCRFKENIPLSQGRDDNEILYITGLALKLGKSENLRSPEVAEALFSHLSVSGGDVFWVKIVPPGWIHLQIKDVFLAEWLQHLLRGGLKQQVSSRGQQSWEAQKLLPVDNGFFPMQYVYARCCALVRLSVNEGIITPQNLKDGLLCLDLPWLDSQGTLRIRHPAEFSLLSQLVQTVDYLRFSHTPEFTKWEKTGMAIIPVFDAFWRQCRIFEVKSTAPQLALARLGLVMVTQVVLRCLLEEKLGILALEEL